MLKKIDDYYEIFSNRTKLIIFGIMFVLPLLIGMWLDSGLFSIPSIPMVAWLAYMGHRAIKYQGSKK